MIATFVLTFALVMADDLNLSPLISEIAQAHDPAVQADLLKGTLDAFGGRRQVNMPKEWAGVYGKLAASPDKEVRDNATKLALIFGDPAAFESLRKQVTDASLSASERIAAIESLAGARDKSVIVILQKSLADKAIRAAALRALGTIDDAQTASSILAVYSDLSTEEKVDAIGTLASRPSFALALLKAIDEKSIPKSDVSAAAINALASHTDARVKTGLNKIWGTIRPTTTEKKEMIARLKQELGAEQIVKGDRAQGRLIFSKTCATCHTLFDSGGNVGPDLTGAQRTNLDYVLSNVVDPSAVVAKDYQVNVFATVDGRVISGIIKSEDARIVKIQTANEIIVVPIADVESRKATPNSLMPEGLLTGWKPEEVRNLMSYLAGSGQVAVPSEGAR